MSRSQFFLFMLLGLSFTLVFKLMHQTAPDQARLARLERIQEMLNEPQEKVIDLNVRKYLRRQQNLDRVATLIAANNAPAADTAANEVKPEDQPRATASAAKKPPTKSEAKKKKKKTAPKVEVTINPSDNKDKNKPSEPETSGESEGSYLAARGAGDIQARDANAEPVTSEDWKRYLLDEPSFERTAVFIKKYSSGVIKQEVFYEVTAALLADPRQDVQAYGVMALGSTPSVDSFIRLVEVANSGDFSSKIKSDVAGYFQTYTRIEYARFLAGVVLIKSDVPSSRLALQLLSTSIRIYLKPTAQTTPRALDDGEQQTTAASTVAANQQIAIYFGSFVGPLNRAVESASDSSIRSEAQGLLTELKDLLRKSPSNSTTPHVGA